jgi:TonB family protein
MLEIGLSERILADMWRRAMLGLGTLILVIVLNHSLWAARTQNVAQTSASDTDTKQTLPLKAINMPPAHYPEEAEKAHVEGKVTLTITVDSDGRVSDAKVVSGPPQLTQAAIEAVRLWRFEPGTHSPVVQNAEITFGFPKECAASTSDMGQVGVGGWYKTARGHTASIADEKDYPIPPYFREERIAGVAGTMILAVSVDANGHVIKIRVVNSLSPKLDKAAVGTVRKWKFKLVDGKEGDFPDSFQVPIEYKSLCDPQF